ncbi:MAG: 50S ribosomal protein L4 [Chloroflexi bacterium]|nr:50S ribosomal protein L4 [Chloroflexota bacterium]
MKLKIRNTQGKVTGDVEVRDDVFGAPMNAALVHQVMVGQLANARQGTVGTKSRGAVSGGGRKPFSQKGTGRARQGTIRAPHMRGGGVVFGPSPRSFRQSTPKRMRRAAMLGVLSDKVREGQMIIIEDLLLENGKTKEMLQVLEALRSVSPVLLVADGVEASVLRASRNIPRLKKLPVSLLSVVDLLNVKTLVITLEAVRRAEELWGGPLRRKPVAPAEAVAS